MDYDTIVVGAGIGGAATAYFLTQAGQRVLVVERERLPRYKTCGGGVPKSVFQPFPFDFSAVVENEVEAVQIAYGGLDHFVVPTPDRPVVTVMRADFDAFVLGRAGADVRDRMTVAYVAEDGAGVTVETAEGERFAARWLVGADGAASVVARRLGLRRGRRLGAGIEAEARVGDRVMARYTGRPLFLFGAVPWGYLWIFPKRRHLSVGIAVFGRSRADLRGILRREMARLGVDLSGVPLHAHPLPLYGGREPLHTRRSLLVGDAAGLVDPLLGEGIRYAVGSARLAAEAIARGDVSGYTAAVHRQIGRSLGWAIWVARLFYAAPGFCYRYGVRNPRIVSLFARLLAGRADYRDVSLRLLPYFVEFLWHRPRQNRWEERFS